MSSIVGTGNTTIEKGKVGSGSGGTEKRDQILPNVPIDDTGYILPDYDLAGNIFTPPEIQISSCGSLQCVIDAARGVLYYSDVIGFGEPGSGMTAGLPYKKMGINFFMKSPLICSNGAKMSTYFEGIPKGDALGGKIQRVLAGMGLPGLKGLAPGMLEDVKHGMDVRPVLQSAFGNVYPVCEEVTLPVGDDLGNIKDPDTGAVWIKGDVIRQGGRAYQKRWVQKTNGRGGNPIYVTREEWENAPKTHNLEGTMKKIITEDNFEDVKKTSLLIAIVLLCGAIAFTYNRK